MRSNLAILLFLVLARPMCAQHTEDHTEEEGSPHQLGLMVGYAWVPNALDLEGRARTFAIPSIGIDYSFWLKERLALRMVNDMELTKYLVQESDGTLLERDFKYIGAIVALYEPLKGVAIYGGPGYEYETHESFLVLKVGTELTKEFNDVWSGGFNISIDINEIYETVSAGMFLAKRL